MLNPNGRVISQIFIKSPLNLNFGQDGCSKPDIARPNSSKTVLLKISQIVIFDNNFA